MVGAGLGRTGTHSLKLALELLLRGRCYHMSEVDLRPADVPLWQRAAVGAPTNWRALLAGYVAAVDWPAAAFWAELAAEYPDALAILSKRETPEVWWASFERTIVASVRRPLAPDDPATPQRRMIRELLSSRFTERWYVREAALQAYRAHLDSVRTGLPRGRLIEWEPGQGWAPLCAGLGLPVPSAPFPHVNTAAEFRVNTGLEVYPTPH